MAYNHMLNSFRIDDDAFTTSPTRKRKHRKCLKDGSGEEVWSEDVEYVFLQGLYAYRESPLVTSHSRRRHKWRNQFLVDYLKRNGVNRTKQQVSSHIQVLQNMWKGKPEFHLVAGGQELYSEQDHTRVDVDSQSGQVFSHLSNAEYISGGSSVQVPPSPGTPLPTFPTVAPPASYDQVLDQASMIPSPKSYSTNIGESEQCTTRVNNHDHVTLVSASESPQGVAPSEMAFNSFQNQLPSWKALELIVDGVGPSWISLDALTLLGHLAPSSPLTLHIELSMRHFISSTTPNLTTFINGQMKIEEDDSLTLVPATGDGYLTAALPGSRLNQCRCLEASLPTVVTQEITADNQTLLFIIYAFNRTPTWASLQLLNFWEFRQSDEAVAAQLSMPLSYSDQ